MVLRTRVDPRRVREYMRVEFLGTVIFSRQPPISDLAALGAHVAFVAPANIAIVLIFTLAW